MRTNLLFYKKYADCGIVYLNDLLFSLDSIRSFDYLKDTGLDSNFLTWSALRLSVPKDNYLSSFPQMEFDPVTFKCENTELDSYSAKSKQFYSLLIVSKAKYPNSFKTLSADFDFSNPLQEVVSIPYNVAGETYVWSFQYKLNNTLFTNTKLFKIGLIGSEKWSFCTIYKEDLYHLFYDCSYSRAFWNRFCNWWTNLRGGNLSSSLKDVIVGILSRDDLLN